ncbi:cellulose biosynthesis protein BcsS [Methylobacterium sp. Leaf88]|uniref:cellulose biosynthesis protein BcsS n=1 Tax=Methylobacterium sp. Leaf88 TaxID=1736244 RepID=UPI000B06932E|nr:cellulose biosynthesis protein BcsS [Methylobacterium sp. Leaf88]
MRATTTALSEAKRKPKRFVVPAACAAGLLGTPALSSSPASLVLFGSLEASPSVFVTTGAKLALDRVDREGFVALGSLGGQRRREGAATRDTAIGAVVLGYQWFRDWGVVAAYAGPEGSMEVVSGCGCVQALPPRFGLRLHGEVWAHPTDATLFAATLVTGTTRMSTWGRLAWGYRHWGAYLGPEIAFSGDGTGYRKWNVGLHATDFALGGFSLRLSAGLQLASDQDPGPYLSLSVWTPW